MVDSGFQNQLETLSRDLKVASPSGFPSRVMASTGSKCRFGDIKFRVLIIGRANAGKTSILQRVCDTTESPAIYRTVGDSREQVSNSARRAHIYSWSNQTWLEPTQEVSHDCVRHDVAN